jgi:hypothetical protein
MNSYTDRTVYDNPNATVHHDRVERTERREMFMRYLLPALLMLLAFAIGSSLGWNAGRNDLLENTYLQDRGMIDRPMTDGIPGPSPSDRVGR